MTTKRSEITRNRSRRVKHDCQVLHKPEVALSGPHTHLPHTHLPLNWLLNNCISKRIRRYQPSLTLQGESEHPAPLGLLATVSAVHLRGYEDDNTASASYRQRPGSSASSASAPRRCSHTTGPASHPAPASFSRCSANGRPPSPHPGPMPERRSGALLHHRCRCWRGAQVWEPLVNQLILKGEHLTAPRWRKASDQPAPGADEQGSAPHEPAARCGDRGAETLFLFPPRVWLCLFLCVRAPCVRSAMPLLRPPSALHPCRQLQQRTDTAPENC